MVSVVRIKQNYILPGNTPDSSTIVQYDPDTVEFVQDGDQYEGR
jgi:hypothetical protein